MRITAYRGLSILRSFIYGNFAITKSTTDRVVLAVFLVRANCGWYTSPATSAIRIPHAAARAAATAASP